ncbi:hypothetical protein P9112_014176 [Eukaryota sp. TZLM1-RC]
MSKKSDSIIDARRDRRRERHHTEHIGRWFRYGPNEQLPHQMGTSGRNGCFYDEDTREILRFRSPEETGYKFVGPKERVGGKIAGPKGGDFNTKTGELEEPRQPSDSFYSDKTYDVQYDA